MYPDLQHIAESIFNAPMPQWLGVIKTFGLFVAIAFLIASSVLVAELKRKEKEGLLTPERSIDKTGEERLVYPHQRAGNIVILALIGGIVGAKIFNAFETWQDFLKDPVGNLFSGGGLTFYGGLIVGGAIIIYYLRKHKIDFRHFADAIAPALMLAYGIGRLGCHFSGDGDWGIFNSAYTTIADGSIQKGSLTDFHQVLNQSAGYFTDNFGALDHVRSLFAPGPSWLPHWFMANNYSHNVINEGIKLTNCTGEYCSVLPVAVFPTSLYEAFVCTLLFGLLWSIRKRFTTPLHLFGLYLILNGMERFFIEKIRVNYKYDWGFLHPTQAEIISTVIVLTGISILLLFKQAPKEINE
jgi:phosphatidylglycerol---prolipoprotein diacylglyceryl transferase